MATVNGSSFLATATEPAARVDHRRGEIAITRLDDTLYVLAPPSEIDEATGLALAKTIADLAYEQPEVVLDLMHVEDVDTAAAQLILHLGALARGAGGRLLVVCPSQASVGFEFHELGTADDDSIDRIEGAFGRALRRLRRAEHR